MNIILLVISVVCLCGFFFLKEKEKPIEIKIGQMAPKFNLPDETGKMRSLDEFKGKKVVLYFYPKDETSGCTAQACQLRDNYDIYKQNNIVILGVSYDSPESHTKFKANQNLRFTLLSDVKKEVAHMYGADKIIGNFVPQRKTFLINEQGKIVYTIENVDIATHSSEILKAFGIKS